MQILCMKPHWKLCRHGVNVSLLRKLYFLTSSLYFFFFFYFTLESPVNLQEWLWRLENATKASIGIVLGSKWVECQFGVNQRPTHRFTHKPKQWILSDTSYSPPQLNFCLTVWSKANEFSVATECLHLSRLTILPLGRQFPLSLYITRRCCQWVALSSSSPIKTNGHVYALMLLLRGGWIWDTWI